jgi:hopanoid-associated phosphorylase
VRLPRVGLICGLISEARCLDALPLRDYLLVRCCGARPGAAQTAAAALIGEGVAALVSFGTAGGLVPGLAPGTLVLGTRVVLADRSSAEPDSGWREKLRCRLAGQLPVVSGVVAGVTEPVLTATAKAALAAQAGAIAVDMESSEVAVAATGGGIPFAVIRAIADPHRRAIPPWVPGLVTADGHTPAGRALAGVVRHPQHLGRLIGLARDSRAAMRSLRRAAALACPLFQFDG